MKKTILISLFALFLFSCGNSGKQASSIADDTPQKAAITVDELYANVANLEDQEVVIKGTVTHVCKEGGARCFIMGSTEDKLIRVEAGEKIGAFSQEQMGSELEIVGVLKMVKTEAQAHNPGQEHGDGQAEDAETAEAHKVIANAQEASEVQYFIEGMKVKEL